MAAQRAELTADDASGAGAGLDAQAKAAYRARVQELRAQLEQARDWADDERAARARQELDFIAHQLAGALGLGGRDRPIASQAERARQNVGRAVHKTCAGRCRAAQLGEHLSVPSAQEILLVQIRYRAVLRSSRGPHTAVSALPSGTVT